MKRETPGAFRPVALLLLALPWLGCAAAPPARADGLKLASTAIVVSVINTPYVVRGDDGADHVEYDLLVTNAFASAVTLSAVEVTGPNGAVLGRIDGATLAAATQGVLKQSTIAAIPPSGSASVEVDLILPPGLMVPGRMPPSLSHHITYAVPDATPHMRAFLGSYEVYGPNVLVPPVRAVVLQPPLRGQGWTAVNGCCTPNAHRDVRIAAGTRIGTAEIFAIDYVRVDGDRFYRGDGKTNAQYPFFGATIHAAAGGTVVSRHDGMADGIPFQESTTLRKPEDFGGNYVLIRQQEGVYAFYCHMEKGSVAVAVGQHVAVGDRLGNVGNSGFSTNPHLHFGLLDRPDFETGNSLPFVFPDFTLSGHVVGGDDDGTLHIKADKRRVRGAYPLVGAIATYP